MALKQTPNVNRFIYLNYTCFCCCCCSQHFTNKNEMRKQIPRFADSSLNVGLGDVKEQSELGRGERLHRQLVYLESE